MKSIVNPLLKSTLVTIVIHVVVITIQIFIDAFNAEELLEIVGLTLPFIFIPTFLSFYFFHPHQSLKKALLKIISINFCAIFLLVFLYFKIVLDSENHSLLSFENFSIATISSFISVFFTLYQRIVSAKITQNQFDTKQLNFSYIKLFLIAFTGALFYGIIAAFDTFFLDETIQIFYKFVPIGFIFSLISMHFFNYIYSQFTASKRKVYTAIYYVLSIALLVFWIVISFNNFRIVKSGLGAALDRAFLVPSILLYAPFFLYVLIVTHLYFLQLVNKQEKSILKQQSLEAQLNYHQLKDQLSPHFLFNNINVLTGLIEENPKKAVLFAQDLSHIYRYFLEQEKQDVVLLQKEMEFAKSYINLLQSRFENCITYTKTEKNNSKYNYIVATVVQQVLENVIKHNEINVEKPMNITVAIAEDYVTIGNNKNPKVMDVASSKKGIENIKKRMAYFTEKEVVVKDLEHSFTIQLPLLELV